MTSTTRSTAGHWTDEGNVNELWYVLAALLPPAGLLAALYFLLRGDRYPAGAAYRMHAASLALVALLAVAVAVAVTV